MKALLLAFVLSTTGLAHAQTDLNETESAPVLEAVRIALTGQGQLNRLCTLKGYMGIDSNISIRSLLSNARTVTVVEGSQPVVIARGLKMNWTDSNASNNHEVLMTLEITTDSSLTQVTEVVAVILPRQLRVDRVNRGTITRPVFEDVPRFSQETRYQCL